MTAVVHRCSNPARWHPTMHTHQDHHHPPKAFRAVLLAADPGVDQSWWKVIPLCGLDHDETHDLLNAYVHARGVPPMSLRRSYSPYVRALVAEAWEHRPSDTPPYTLTSQGDAHA